MSLLSDPAQPPQGSGRRRTVAGAVALGLLLLGLYAWRHSRPAPPAAPALPKPSPAASLPRTVGVGTLHVTADLSGATVTLDGRTLGIAPQRIADLSAGPHHVRVELAGHEAWERDAHVVPNVTTEVVARLREALPRLKVESDVPGATVFVDQKYAGQTPLSLPTIGRGTHRLTVSAEGYDMYVETVDVGAAPQVVSVRLKEVRLDEALEVTHRHGLGSCSGRLSATPSGLRYEAAGSNDGFDAPLASVERLEVDYLRKNLAVRLRGGRTYNFTVPRGSADPLLVFQQKVEKARQRLAGVTS